MQSHHIAILATLLFFTVIVGGLIIIVVLVYRARAGASLAITRENEEALGRTASEERRRHLEALPEALPGPSSSLNEKPALANALIHNECQWRGLQSDLVAVDVSSASVHDGSESARPTSESTGGPRTEAENTDPSVFPLPRRTTMRQVLHQGGFVIVKRCRAGEADTDTSEACSRATASRAMEQGMSECAIEAANHVESPDRSFSVYKPSKAPYGQSQYISVPVVPLGG
ncbi:hypothetical protein Q4I30_006395 [Leishmania utingensis]|uniref:Uncharacterized protein n=1 Tax=Leishmania utingensis TaxID=653362 RepID=A0AAW3A5Y9_9TRYP